LGDESNILSEKSKHLSENVDFFQDKNVGICPAPGIQEPRGPASKNLCTPLALI